jgi:hypothetical protein
MVQRGEDLRFSLETGEAIRIASEDSGRSFSPTLRLSFVSRARYAEAFRCISLANFTGPAATVARGRSYMGSP